MPVTINGDGSITGLAVGGLPDGCVDADTLAAGAAVPADGSITTAKLASGAITSATLPAGSIIQTVIASAPQGGSSLGLSGSITSPTFLHSNAKVTITPQFSNSKILLTWAAQIRLNPSSNGFVGVFYSANSNMSSPSVVEKYRSNNINESYRTVTDSHYMFQSWSRSCVDETISNTNTRYYNVGGYAAGGGMEHGDNGVTCTLIAQEIKV